MIIESPAGLGTLVFIHIPVAGPVTSDSASPEPMPGSPGQDMDLQTEGRVQ